MKAAWAYSRLLPASRSPELVLGTTFGLLLDQILGDPPDEVHPVDLFGRMMRRIEATWTHKTRTAGLAHLAIGAGTAAAAGSLLAKTLGPFASTAIATAVAAASRSLWKVAAEIATALESGNLDLARSMLPSLCGRDNGDLGSEEIASAVVESVAENTVDAITAPVFWAVVAGAPGVFVHRAINTLDAQVGYTDEIYSRFGWASARADDAAAYLPARLTAVLVASVRPQRAIRVWSTITRDAPKHPSPNAGVAESAFAAALGLRLGGPVSYRGIIEKRSYLGEGAQPTAGDISRAIRLSRDVTWALCALAVFLSRRRWPMSGVSPQ